ncbi:hypothetical protein CSB37_00595 [bacterium DOLZORAL124_38_8]|nr:MAG: hypothetical protein CSB37_00595 [bacterium DOLZORAL124_38_8]
MGFEKAGNLLAGSLQKYGLTRQVSAALVCKRAQTVLQKNYPALAEFWTPKKFVDGGLSVAAQSSAAKSKLFLETQTILDVFKQDEVLKHVEYIKIVNV